MSEDEKRGYSRGYAAGRKRAVADGRAEHIAARKEDFTQRMMIAIAPQIISSPWGRKKGDRFVADSGAKEIMGTIRMIAEAGAARSFFHHDPLPKAPSHD